MSERKRPIPKQLVVDARVKNYGLDIILNNEKFPLVYPKQIWSAYPADKKELLKDNIAYSATIFLPQIFGLGSIAYKTPRPVAESFLFENGIKEMPCCALVDAKSTVDYIKNFFNTKYYFAENKISVPRSIDFRLSKKMRVRAVIPFSFGKESALSFCLARELGIEPVLVNFIEPSNSYEYHHKKKLIKEFESEFNIKIHTVQNTPGAFRYGYHWNMKTELGWGLQTTEYALMSLPFLHRFGARYLILGNEQSCNDEFFDKENVLVCKAGYDQFSDWTPQQGILSSLLLGRKIEVVSFLEPLYEIAINKILHNRYPFFSKYLMSCMADNKAAKNKRWCASCVKCGYIYALCCAFNFNLKEIGFTANLFDRRHAKIYDHFFHYDWQNPAYGSQEELGLAFYFACKNGHRGASIDRFKKELLPKFEKNKDKLINKYLGLNKYANIPKIFEKKLLSIYHQELKS